MLKNLFLISLLSVSLMFSGCANHSSLQISKLVTPDEKRENIRAIAEAIELADKRADKRARGYTVYVPTPSMLTVGDQSFGLTFTDRKKNRFETPLLQGVANAFVFIGSVGIIPFCQEISVNYVSNIDNLSYGSSHYDCIGWMTMKTDIVDISSSTVASDNVDKILYDLFDLGYMSVDKVGR